jgi:CheY-like chemotaxis protein
MKANINPRKGTSSCGSLLSLFGRKIYPLSNSVIPREEPEPAPASPTQGRRILVVDDDPVFLKATEIKLRAHGYSVFTAVDGPSAFEAAHTQRPDVILLDLVFPATLPTSWDGFAIMEWLMQMNWFPSTPIIICTGSQASDLGERANSARVAGIFRKPLDYASLLSLIDIHLNSHGRPESGPAGAAFNN